MADGGQAALSGHEWGLLWPAAGQLSTAPAAWTQLYCTLYTALYCTAGCTVHRLTASCSWSGAVELGCTQICLAQALKYDFGKRMWKLLSSVLEMSQRVIYFRKNDYEWKWKLLSGKDFYWIHKRHTFVIYDCFVRIEDAFKDSSLLMIV